MAESIFKTRTLKEIYDEIRKVYLSDNRPWILGFSGGKDSTCMAQLVWNALSELPPEDLQKRFYIISSDTLVESPQISERIIGSLDKIEKIAMLLLFLLTMIVNKALSLFFHLSNIKNKDKTNSSTIVAI